jgi:competence protein ComEA
MKIFQKINRTLGLTPNESRVVYFLVISFVVGWAVKLFYIDRQRPAQFDYRKPDSVFAARSALIPALDSADEQSRDSVHQAGFAISKKYLLESLAPGSIHLNDATKEQLLRLPGVGDSTADAILNYRKDNGPFDSIDGLIHIKGIGPKKFKKMKPYLAL